MKRALAVILALGLVSACATPLPPPPPPPPPPPAPPPPPPAPEPEGMGQFAPSGAAAELAGPQTYLGPIPTAVVLLEPGQNARNKAFCDGYVGLPTVPQLAADSAYAPARVATRWLLTVSDATEEQAKDCGFLLQKYDYNRGVTLKNALSQDTAMASQLTGAGPFIVELLPDGSAMVVNGSAVPVATLGQMPSAWVMAASMQAQQPLQLASGSGGAPPPAADARATCSPMTMNLAQLQAAGCTPTSVFTATVTDVLKERLPEAEVLIAGGRVLACWLANRCAPPAG